MIATLAAAAMLGGLGVASRAPRASALGRNAPAPHHSVVVRDGGLAIEDPQAFAELFAYAEAQPVPPGSEPLPAGVHLASVPSAGVVTRRGRAFVLTARPGDRLEPQPVRIVHEGDGRTVVAGPLTAGERVVGAGAIYLLNMLTLQGLL